MRKPCNCYLAIYQCRTGKLQSPGTYGAGVYDSGVYASGGGGGGPTFDHAGLDDVVSGSCCWTGGIAYCWASCGDPRGWEGERTVEICSSFLLSWVGYVIGVVLALRNACAISLTVG